MKAPKNFYNTVDQSKLGIDDLFTRTAENEEDITALENVVGDLDGGLVKDVHDLQGASEQYHDDIADLKSADITLGLRIDDVSNSANLIITATADLTVNPRTITFSDTIAHICSRILNATKPTYVHALGHDANYTYDFWFRASYIDHFDDTIYFECIQAQSSIATIYSFYIKPRMSGNSTTYSGRNV